MIFAVSIILLQVYQKWLELKFLEKLQGKTLIRKNVISVETSEYNCKRTNIIQDILEMNWL